MLILIILTTLCINLVDIVIRYPVHEAFQFFCIAVLNPTNRALGACFRNTGFLSFYIQIRSKTHGLKLLMPNLTPRKLAVICAM